MSGLDIHPEDLLDKHARGALSAAESERLRVHLESCEVCRFEISVRSELGSEAAQVAATLRPPNLSGASARAGKRTVRPVKVSASGLSVAVFVIAAGALASWETARGARNHVAANATDARAAARVPGRVAPPRAVSPPAANPSAEPRATPTPVGADMRAARAGESVNSQLLPSKSRANAARAERAPSARARDAERSANANSASAAASASEPSNAQSLFSAANRARRDGDFERAGALYRDLQRQFPQSQEAELSQISLGMLVLARDPSAALASFEAYLSRPSRALTAEALVGRAQALRKLGRSDDEKRAWGEVLARYPGSVYATEARERLGIQDSP